MAALNGNLPMLQWARANGCTWDDETTFRAKENCHEEVFKWAKENGCPGNGQ
jgi:hypothetical protein